MLKIFVLAFLLQHVNALYLEGRLHTKKDWVFLSRFCFLSDIGRMQFKFTYPYKDCCNNVLLYFDDGVQWPKVYRNDSKNCNEKEAILEPENNQIINLTTRYTWSGCQVKNISNEGVLECQGGRSFRSMQERWWYIAISNCKAGERGIDMNYEMKLTNGHSFWTEHFSADEFGMLETNIFFLILLCIMLVVSFWSAASLCERQLFHTTYKIFILCLVLEVFGLLMLCVSLGTFASDGIGNPTLTMFGEVLGAVAELFFLLLLLLLGKGFTVTRGQLSYSGTIKMSVFITVFAVVGIVLFLYQYVWFDPGLVLYVYESPAGYGLIGLRLFAWVWFTYGVIFSLKHYPEKSSFYYPFYIMYSIWFYAVPVMVVIATNSIPRYMRARVVNGLQRTIDCLAYLIFLTLTRPNAANENFPYHVRTSQVGVVVISDGKPYASSNFPHNIYAESSMNANGGNQTTFDLFTVSSAVSASNPIVIPTAQTSSLAYDHSQQINQPPPYSGPRDNCSNDICGELSINVSNIFPNAEKQD